MNTSARLVIVILIINTLISCARNHKPQTSITVPGEGENSSLAVPQSYRAELQGKVEWQALETQTISVTYDKQSRIAAELAAKITEESQQSQQQLHDLLEKNKQLQRELRKKK